MAADSAHIYDEMFTCSYIFSRKSVGIFPPTESVRHVAESTPLPPLHTSQCCARPPLLALPTWLSPTRNVDEQVSSAAPQVW